MKQESHLETKANRIADAIVKLVERTDGAVTLAMVHDEISGFAKLDPPAWAFYATCSEGEKLIWDGMTEEGSMALRKVLNGRRVAVQFVDIRPYLMGGGLWAADNWQPIVLLPQKAANVKTPNWDLRVPAKNQAAWMAAGATELKPCPVRFTLDQFAVA
jgi:hypothetical protein